MIVTVLSLRYCLPVFGAANAENDADWKHAKKGENQMKKILDIITMR